MEDYKNRRCEDLDFLTIREVFWIIVLIAVCVAGIAWLYWMGGAFDAFFSS